MRRFESNCFSNVEMNTSPAQQDQVRQTVPTEPPLAPPIARYPPGTRRSAYGEVIGLTRDELGYNDTDYHFEVESERFQGLE